MGGLRFIWEATGGGRLAWVPFRLGYRAHPVGVELIQVGLFGVSRFDRSGGSHSMDGLMGVGLDGWVSPIAWKGRESVDIKVLSNRAE